MSQQTRQHALQIFHQALAQSSLEAAVTRALHCDAHTLSISNHTLPLAPIRKIHIIALGKGAAPLFDGVRRALPANLPVQSVISAPSSPSSITDTDKYFHGGHPQPNAASLQAAQAALSLLSTADASTLVLFLITGGASAMFEAPISPTISLDDLIHLNRLLVSSGAPIREINTVRKHLSAVKGGRLALAASNAATITLLVSDVPASQLDALASGPTLADPTTVSDCLAVLDRYHLRPHLPASIQQILAPGVDLPNNALLETPKTLTTKFPPIVLLDNNHLLHQAAAHATALGYAVHIDNTPDDWDYAAAADYLLHRIRTLTSSTQPQCLLSGGEVTVTLPHTIAATAIGGRNQHFALACALKLHSNENKDEEEIIILSAGSDGIDGNSTAAGAVADSTTLARAAGLGLNPQALLDAFNSAPLFQALGDAITTGPTGNNLRDLRILLRA